MYRVWNFLTNYSLLLIIGAIVALIWANTNPISYHHFVIMLFGIIPQSATTIMAIEL